MEILAQTWFYHPSMKMSPIIEYIQMASTFVTEFLRLTTVTRGQFPLWETLESQLQTNVTSLVLCHYRGNLLWVTATVTVLSRVKLVSDTSANQLLFSKLLAEQSQI